MKENILIGEELNQKNGSTYISEYEDESFSKSKNLTYLTTKELSQRIKYDARTIRERLKDSVLLEGVHYFHPFGGRKILYIWEQIEIDMFKNLNDVISIPLANGGVFNG